MSSANPPIVVIDNDASEEATVIQVESVNKHGILLEVVQVLTDMNLVITKTLESDASFVPSMRGTVGVMPSEDHTSIELSGTDRPGLLSKVCAVLVDLHWNVVNAEIWTHNARVAAVVHVTDDSTGCAIEDPNQLSKIKELLCNVLEGNNDLKTAKMTFTPWIMFADRDYQRVERAELGKDKSSRPRVTVLDCIEKDYTVITMRSKDRPKLLFDTICTLTDMQYVVFHGVVHTGRMEAYQGLELELCTEDRFGRLSDITRVFRENSLCIERA
ncbi:hypothetical protein PVL29_021356 [Vitis rotundifolia]|uniref:ACT domain-containing protein ACR n=1 Tax=Vitis rotundifolia TaxID=103349 RepID=A0AA38YZA5_VITRO|nr:hypothetical protein PVL29_021356 [Vitis rotundifolia]